MSCLATCVVCNEELLQVEPDQITHPCCDPDDTPLPVLSVDEIAETLGGRVVAAPPPDTSSYPVLFAGSDICRDCGEPYSQDGLSTRYQRRHWAWQAEGRRRGWNRELINALSNKQPVHAACARARS
jgi:hypothetical protein